MMQILVGDIDAHRSVLSLFKGERDELVLDKSQSYENATFSGLVSMVGDFMHGARVDAAAFAVTGSVHAGSCQSPDLPWEISEAELRPILGTDHCVLLNDVQAAALGIEHSDRTQWAWLQRAPIDPSAAVAVVSVDVSYGRALLVPPNLSFASEAGLAGFAPRNAIERRLLSYLAESVEEVSLSHVLSAPGLRRLHDFLVFEGLAPATALAEIERAPDPNAELARLGSRDLDRACAAAVASFADILGAQLSNVALSCLPRGGLFLIGSMARCLRGVFEQGELLDSFLDRRVLSHLLESIPLVLVDDPRLATLGAKRAALEL
ncbi:MAG: glucokinase [Myxococcales bacterium]